MSKKEGFTGDFDEAPPEFIEALRRVKEHLDQVTSGLADGRNDGWAGSHFFRRHGLQTSLFKRMARWGLVEYVMNGHGPKVRLAETGIAWLAIDALRQENKKAVFHFHFAGAVTGRTSSAQPNLQAIPRPDISLRDPLTLEEHRLPVLSTRLDGSEILIRPLGQQRRSRGR